MKTLRVYENQQDINYLTQQCHQFGTLPIDCVERYLLVYSFVFYCLNIFYITINKFFYKTVHIIKFDCKLKALTSILFSIILKESNLLPGLSKY